MSVLKSDRSTSPVQFLESARQLEVYTLRMSTKLPKRYLYLHTIILTNLSHEIYNKCKMANSVFPSYIDHYYKDNFHEKYYARYMDDGYIISNSKEYLQHCLLILKILCDECKILLNERKTQISKINKGFIFLKTKFLLTESGEVVVRPHRDSIIRMRRKLKSFKYKYELGLMTKTDIDSSYKSWRGSFSKKRTHISLKRIDSYYNLLFN